MTPLCTHCGAPLTYWRALDRIPVDKGAVKDARHYVCVPCRRVYRVTLTCWRESHQDQWPKGHEWATLIRRATPTADTDTVDPIAEAVQVLGPLVDVDRLRLARLVASWWNTAAGARNTAAAARAIPGLNPRRAGRAVDDAAALGLIDLADRPFLNPAGGEAARPNAYRCEVCGHLAATARGLGSHRLTHRPTVCSCGWTGTAAEHRSHIRWHCPDRDVAS